MSAQQTHVLSPLDQHGPKVYTRMAIIFECTDYEGAIADLQKALSATCDQIPFLKGKVSEKGIDERKQSYITWNPSDLAPQFQERPATDGTPSYKELQFNRTPFPPEIFPNPVPMGQVAPDGAPVLAASYTKIEGGLVMCVVTYHKVIDGSGYSNLLRVLSNNCRHSGFVTSSSPPDPEEIPKRRERIVGTKSRLPQETQNLDFEALLERHPEYCLKSRKTKAEAAGVAGAPKYGAGTNAVFAFSRQRLDSIKASLKDKLPSKYLTVNNILTALIWTSITHIRNTRPEGPLAAKTSKMDYSVGYRGLIPSLKTPDYLGNALGYALAELPIEQIAFIPNENTVEKLGAIISHIAEASDHLTAEHVAEIVQLSDKNPDLSDIGPSWFFGGPGDLHFTSWAQVGIYDLYFGPRLGEPKYMRSAFMKFNGVVTMLPRRRVPEEQGDEAIEVSVLLREDDMARLAGDEAWKSWLVKETQNGA